MESSLIRDSTTPQISVGLRFASLRMTCIRLCHPEHPRSESCDHRSKTHSSDPRGRTESKDIWSLSRDSSTSQISRLPFEGGRVGLRFASLRMTWRRYVTLIRSFFAERER